jgi:hypothetical protein
MFRKPTRVSLLSRFPETPTMYDALCTHNTTGFQFALYIQSVYIPTMPVQPEEALYTQSRYTPTMHYAVFTQWLYTRTIKFELYTQSEYTPTMQSALSTRFLPLVCIAVSILFLFTQKNGAKRDSRHI